MQYYELSISLKLEKDLNNNEIYYFVNRFINNEMLKDSILKEKHGKNEYKYYTYGSLWPISKDKVYKKEQIYILNIRSIDRMFIMRLKRVLINTEDIKVISKEIKTYSKQFISELTTLTPIVITMPNKRYWIPSDGIQEALSRITKNIIKKYNTYYDKDISIDTQFMEGIIQLNKIPIKVPYKNTTLIGNKFTLRIKEDKFSQELAFFAKAVGLGEKGSIGLGYTASK